MTITCQPMDATSGAPAYSAQNERQNMASLYGGGGGVTLAARSGFRVGTPSNILTATSTTWTLGPCAAVISPGAATAQGSYRWSADANVTGSVRAANATYARKDIVYIQVNDSSSGDGSGALSAPPTYAYGPEDGTNVPPALPARSFLVGTISVPIVGGGSPTVVLNPAVFVAAGAPQPVWSQAERDALAPYDGLTVKRMDVAGRPMETWGGSKWWNGPLGIAYTPIWTGAINFGSGGSMTGTYWVNGDRVTVRAKVISGTGASLGSSVIAFPLPAGYPLAAGLVLGTGAFQTAGGVVRTLHCYAGSSTTCSVWAPNNPIATPGNASYPFAAGDSIEALITYQTS